jgi:hypothetical protein
VLRVDSEHWPGNRVPGLRFIQKLEFNEVLQRTHESFNGLGCTPPAEETGGAIDFIGPPNKPLMKVDREFHNGFGRPFFYYSSKQHLDTMSFRHIVGALFISRGHSWRAHANANLAPGQVPAVLVNCFGDKQVFKRARTEAFRVPADFYECKFIRSIPVAKKIGIPMVFYPIAHEAAWHGRTHGNFPYDMNPQLTLISPLNWECTWGTVSVARKDKKPLHTAHLEALMNYCWELDHSQIYDFSDLPRGTYWTEPIQDRCNKHHQALIKKASKEDFKAFWDDWWLGPGRDQYGWVDSPYDIREEKGIEETMFNMTGKMPTVNQAGPMMIGEAGPLLIMM